MVLRRIWRPAVAGTLLILGGSAAIGQRTAGLTALNSIELGQWQLRDSDGGGRNMCLTHRAALLQIAHGAIQCEHFVMENTPTATTIRYTCPGHGHGRTTVSVATPRAVQIETQGVIDGAPFSKDYDARRTGNCG